MSSISDDSSIRLSLPKPRPVGMNKTEGHRLLNALMKLQHKLNTANNGKTTTTQTSSASGDSKAATNKVLDEQQNVRKSNAAQESIENRLQTIESQLKTIVSMMTSTHHNNDSHPTASSLNDHHKQINARIDSKQFVNKINCNQRSCKSKESHVAHNQIKADDKISVGPRHYLLQSKDIPFLLGTTGSKSHSIIAQRQMQIAKLKQHNPLCDQRAPPRIFSENIKNNVLEHELKELLYDLQEEHNYICEEINLLTNKMESISDAQHKAHIQHELYFLSRRILAKRKQINELQDVYSIIMSKNVKKQDLNTMEMRPKVNQATKTSHTQNRSQDINSLPKWT